MGFKWFSRNRGGKIKGERNGSTYEEHDGKFWKGTENQIGVTRDELKELLNGKRSPKFSETRKEYWLGVHKLVEDGIIRRDEFTEGQLRSMEQGRSPFAPRGQRLGDEVYEKKYNLHHKDPIHNGGDVHDLDNLTPMTPLYHQTVLDEDFHYGPKHGAKARMKREEKENRYREQIQRSRDLEDAFETERDNDFFTHPDDIERDDLD